MTTVVTPRDILRNYKAVFQQVQRTKQPAIFVHRKQPQVAIVSLEDLEQIEQLRRKNSAKALLTLAKEIHALLKDEHLPPDLSARHDYYLWEEDSA